MKTSTKVKRRFKKKGKRYAYLTFFKVLYLSGLAFLVPFALAFDVPEEIGIWSGTQEALLVISLFLVCFSVYGVYTQSREKWNKTLRVLGLMTLIPGGVSLILALVGEPLLSALATRRGPLTPLIETAIGNSVNRVWYLTLVFIILGLALYYLSKQKLR